MGSVKRAFGVLAAIGSLVVLTADICAAQTVTEYPVPTSNSGVGGLAAGPDGNLWFTEYAANKIGKITTVGAMTEYNIPTSASGPSWITAGPDGNLWFTESNSNKIGKITTSGVFTEYAIPTAGSNPNEIVAGPDGNLWFTEGAVGKIGKITTGGTITEYAIPFVSGSRLPTPWGITAGPDGNVWFSDKFGNQIDKITTGGTITEYAIPTNPSDPTDMALGPDGNLWFTEVVPNSIAKITTSGTVTEYNISSNVGVPGGTTAGPDGNVWFTELHSIGKITPAGTITEYALPADADGPGPLALGADGNLWFTEYFTNKIGVISTGPVVSTLPHVADGDGFDTLVLLINKASTDATYSLKFFNQNGNTVNYPLDPAQSGMTGTIHAFSQAIVRTTGSGTSTHVGWGQLTAPASVKGMVIYQQQASATSLQEGSAPIAAPSEHLFFPFDNVGAATTSIGFVNPSVTQSATVNFTVRYASGGVDTVPAFTMNPMQQMAQGVTGIWPATAGQRGMIEVNSNTPIGMVAFRFQGSAFTLFDTIPPTAGGSTPITSTIAHSADGNNFRSTFLLTNSGTAAARYTLSILDATGQPQTFGFDVASPLSGTVPAGSTLTIDTTGLGGVTNLGWAQLSAPPAVSGIEVFRQTNPGQSEQQATIPISQTNLAHLLIPFDNAANITSIALANPDPAVAATINVTLRYADGTSSTGQVSLPARNYKADLLSNFVAATAGKAGVAEFTSNVPIAVVEVRFNSTQAFTSLRAVGP